MYVVLVRVYSVAAQKGKKKLNHNILNGSVFGKEKKHYLIIVISIQFGVGQQNLVLILTGQQSSTSHSHTFGVPKSPL